jgi:C1A family cysteine protease
MERNRRFVLSGGLLVGLGCMIAGLVAVMFYHESESSLLSRYSGFRSAHADEESKLVMFENWKSQFNKVYLDTAEALRRKETWLENFDWVLQHNGDPAHTYKVALNKFADLSVEEWRSKLMNNFKHSTLLNVLEINESNLPAEVDWRKSGAVSAVQTQGDCGDCWAFSTVGALEGLAKLTTDSLMMLSVQQMVDCSQSYGNQGCYGGKIDYAFQYSAAQGIVSDVDYPYTGLDEPCHLLENVSRFYNLGYQDVLPNNSRQLAAAVSKQPVSIGIKADARSLQLYDSGIYNDLTCGDKADHAVLIVGYGNTNNQDYWIIKNSWGTNWGLEGYMMIEKTSENGPGICGLATMPSYPTSMTSNLGQPEKIEEKVETIKENAQNKEATAKLEYYSYLPIAPLETKRLDLNIFPYRAAFKGNSNKLDNSDPVIPNLEGLSSNENLSQKLKSLEHPHEFGNTGILPSIRNHTQNESKISTKDPIEISDNSSTNVNSTQKLKHLQDPHEFMNTGILPSSRNNSQIERNLNNKNKSTLFVIPEVLNEED